MSIQQINKLYTRFHFLSVSRVFRSMHVNRNMIDVIFVVKHWRVITTLVNYSTPMKNKTTEIDNSFQMKIEHFRTMNRNSEF